MADSKFESKSNKPEASISASTSTAKQYIGDAFTKLLKDLRDNPVAVSSGAFKKECQELIERYGFIEFEREFDKIVSEASKVYLNMYAPVLKAVHEYIMEQVADAVYAITLETATVQADFILTSLARNPEKKEVAQKTATDEKYLGAKEEAIKTIKKEETKQVKAIQAKTDLSPEDRENQIREVHERSEEKIKKINEQPTMPIEYYELKNNKKTISDLNKYYTLICFDDVEMIMHFVKKDILQRPTIDERTLAMERYIWIANSLIESGRLDAAMPIIGALTSEQMVKRKTTLGGLSPAALNLYNRMNESNAADPLYQLVKSGINPQKIEYCAEKNAILPTTSICVKIDALGNLPAMYVSEEGEVTDAKGYDKLIENSGRVKITPLPENEGIAQLTDQIKNEGIQKKQAGYDLSGLVTQPTFDKGKADAMIPLRSVQTARRDKEISVFVSHVDETKPSAVVQRAASIATSSSQSTPDYKSRVPKDPNVRDDLVKGEERDRKIDSSFS